MVIVSCQSHFSNPAFSSTIPFIHKTPFFLQVLLRGSIPALTTASPRAGSVLNMFSGRGELDMSLGTSSQREQFSWGECQNGISLKWGLQKSMMPFNLSNLDQLRILLNTRNQTFCIVSFVIFRSDRISSFYIVS